LRSNNPQEQFVCIDMSGKATSGKINQFMVSRQCSKSSLM
jgi:hypothetical protein